MAKKHVLVSIIASTILLTGCSSATSATMQQQPATPSSDPAVSVTAYTLADVQKHNTVSDCWTVMNGHVYNITPYVQSGNHPGGPAIRMSCGIDATSIFAGKHKNITYQTLNQYLIGKIN